MLHANVQKPMDEAAGFPLPPALTAFQREPRIYKAKGTPSLSEDQLSSLSGPSEEAIATTVAETVATSIKDVAHSLNRITGAINVASIDAADAFSREDATELVRTFVGAALHIADTVGLVVTVENRPHHQLAMGAYDSVVDVRDHRKVYNAHLYEKDAPAPASRELKEVGKDETGETYYAVCASPIALGHPLPSPVVNEVSCSECPLQAVLEGCCRREPEGVAKSATSAPLAADFGTYEHPYVVPHHPV
jgi:hypothetical protein